MTRPDSATKYHMYPRYVQCMCITSSSCHVRHFLYATSLCLQYFRRRTWFAPSAKYHVSIHSINP